MFRFRNVVRNLSLTAVFLAGFASTSVVLADDDFQSHAGLDEKRIAHFGYGTAASPEQIAGWDIDVRADGVGLPAGSGSVADGEWLYEAQCAECHGSFGEGVGRYPALAGGEGTLTHDRPDKTVGSYWPYTSTLFDYIRRTMPFTQPGSLTVDQTYALSAYVLYLNDLVDDDAVLNQENLVQIRLPNEQAFTEDPRPDVKNRRCMRNCRKGQEITVHSKASDVYVPTQRWSASQVASAEVRGGNIYESYCALCHTAGIGGAPVLGDRAVWQGRQERGEAQLIGNAIQGIVTDDGVMPPKGGFMQLTDAEVSAAVRYMLEAVE